MAYAVLANYGMAIWQSAWSVSVFVCKSLLLGLLTVAILRRWFRGSFKESNDLKKVLSVVGGDYKQLILFYGFEIVVSIFAAGITLSLTEANPYLASLVFLAIMLPSLVLKGLPKADERIYTYKHILLLLVMAPIIVGAFVISWLLPSLAALSFYGVIFWEL